MMVAVGFSPRGGSANPGVAERRLKASIGSSVQASLRDAHPSSTVISVGSSRLKPTATVAQSLRDFAKTEMNTSVLQQVRQS